MRPLTKRQLSKLSWQEWKYTKTMAGDTSVELMAADYPAHGWINIELGFGFGEGPSIMYAQHTWEEKKRKEAKETQDKETRNTSKKKRETADDRAKAALILTKES